VFEAGRLVEDMSGGPFSEACRGPSTIDVGIALRLGYVPALATALEDRMQRILATLYRLSFPRGTAR